MWNLKYNINEPIYKTNRPTNAENKLMTISKGESGGGMSQEFGISRHKLLYIKQIDNKVLLHMQGTLFNIL